eukprot:TRINITY_DN546_c0_g1_i10.p1 TRINITY_DN546_c0_g1~~TRINITY_DN546_c0_g1_i10.p1  ORF type:complete len:344 (-),score=66.82 TRINITY_DN546_c0_g1_i10:669-1700(-)
MMAATVFCSPSDSPLPDIPHQTVKTHTSFPPPFSSSSSTSSSYFSPLDSPVSSAPTKSPAKAGGGLRRLRSLPVPGEAGLKALTPARVRTRTSRKSLPSAPRTPLSDSAISSPMRYDMSDLGAGPDLKAADSPMGGLDHAREDNAGVVDFKDTVSYDVASHDVASRDAADEAQHQQAAEEEPVLRRVNSDFVMWGEQKERESQEDWGRSSPADHFHADHIIHSSGSATVEEAAYSDEALDAARLRLKMATCEVIEAQQRIDAFRLTNEGGWATLTATPHTEFYYNVDEPFEETNHKGEKPRNGGGVGGGGERGGRGGGGTGTFLEGGVRSTLRRWLSGPVLVD